MAFGSMSMPKSSPPGMSGKKLGPRKPSMKVGGIRTSFTQGIATPKLGKR
jgi:hypothetical protein